MLGPGSIRLRLRLAIAVTAMIPLIVAVMLAEVMVRQTSARFFVPEIGERLDQSLELYQELARAVKSSMRHEATAIAAHEPLRRAAQTGNVPAIERELRILFPRYPSLVTLMVHDEEGEELARVDRGRPVNDATENELEVLRSLAGRFPTADTSPDAPRVGDSVPETDDSREVEEGPHLVAVFATDRARFDQLEGMSRFVDMYRQIERRREADEAAYVYAFAVLLGLTILAAIGVGGLTARGVAMNIRRLNRATKLVAAGDLSIRVPETGPTEIAALATAFNRMLSEVESSRARIEYLQRMATWQEMARRLAHEIKNPLTPIQLAVQELHRRYGGEDAKYQTLVDSTLEIVEDEVGTLRRLVTEFSDFARLPRAELREEDLAAFLRDQLGRLPSLSEEELSGDLEFAEASVELDLTDDRAPVYMDRQMLRRALINLVRNAKQATAPPREQEIRSRVRVSLSRDNDYWSVCIDDNGPGIPKELRDSIFDPYVTTKTAGTGLGLAITKKIVVEHGGSIVASESPLGGARLHLRLPVAGTGAARAALEACDWQPASARPAHG